MRIRTLSTVLTLALAAAACTGTLTDDPGDPGDGSDNGGGGGGGGGSGSGSGSGSASNGLSVTVDKATIDTELMTTHTINVALQGTGGFAGDVSLTASVVDAAGTAIPDWTVTLSTPSVTLAANGTGAVTAELKIPSATLALSGKVKINATSTAANVEVNTAVTALNQVTFAVSQTGDPAQCAYPASGGNAANPVVVLVNTKVRILNTGAKSVTIHGSGSIPHQSTAEAAKLTTNTAYEPAIGNRTGLGSWYCHAVTGTANSPNPGAQGPAINVMAP
jgi:hypothetical protein